MVSAWAKRLSWTAVAEAFHTTWDHVFRSVAMAVRWGLAHRDLAGITAIGIDEFARRRGHRYVTLVYQLDPSCRRLLWIGRDRKARTLLGFFRWLGPKRTAILRFVCSNMWKPYLRVVAKKAGHAVHVLDRFHIMVHLNKAIDEVRATEARVLKARGVAPVLTRTRWLLLKRPANVTDAELPRLVDLLHYNLRAVRSYLLREEFQYFWTYVSPTWAGRFLDRWCTKVLRSRIEPMQKVARMLRSPRVAPELVPRQGHPLGRDRRGVQQQGESDHQNRVRVPDVSCDGNGPLSHPWCLTGEPEAPHRF